MAGATQTTMTDGAAKKRMEAAAERARGQRVEKPTAAKAEAASARQGTFDLAKLETMYDTSHAGRRPPVEERQTEHEWMDYVHFRDIMTLGEHAAKVEERNRW